MNSGGISRGIIAMAQAWVGHIRGGLGYVAIGASVLMASMSGSALADTAALATILLPMMREQGCPMQRVCRNRQQCWHGPVDRHPGRTRKNSSCQISRQKEARGRFIE